MNVIFLDHDGVICLSPQYAGRFKKYRLAKTAEEKKSVHNRFDNFDKKAVKVLNDILLETNAEIVVSSDWRLYATVEELGEYYTHQGIIKKPIDFTAKYNGMTGNFPWTFRDHAAQVRSIEIERWLKAHPEVEKWVAIDDLNLGRYQNPKDTEEKREWGLDNFVHTPRPSEGIKQTGVKDKILKYFK